MQLAENVVKGFRRIWIATDSAFDDGQAQTPDVALHTISSTTSRAGLLDAASCNTFRCHITLAANISLRNTGDQIAAHAEIANLDLTSGIDENISRLHVPMNDVMIIFEGLQSHNGG